MNDDHHLTSASAANQTVDLLAGPRSLARSPSPLVGVIPRGVPGGGRGESGRAPRLAVRTQRAEAMAVAAGRIEQIAFFRVGRCTPLPIMPAWGNVAKIDF